MSKLNDLEKRWIANKRGSYPRDIALAGKLRAARQEYRDEYRPLPAAGVTLGREVA